MSEEVAHDQQVRFWSFYRGNFRLHGLFFLMASAVIVCSFVMSAEGAATVRAPWFPIQMPETCMSRRLWGIDCPGCGLTRSFISMSHGEFARAFSFNVAGPIVYLFVFVQIPWHAFQMFRLWNFKRPIESGWLYVPLFSMSAVILSQWLWRLCRGDLF